MSSSAEIRVRVFVRLEPLPFRRSGGDGLYAWSRKELGHPKVSRLWVLLEVHAVFAWQPADLIFVGAPVSYSRRSEGWLPQLWEVDFSCFRSVCGAFPWFHVPFEMLVTFWVRLLQLLGGLHFVIYNTGTRAYSLSELPSRVFRTTWNMKQVWFQKSQVWCSALWYDLFLDTKSMRDMRAKWHWSDGLCWPVAWSLFWTTGCWLPEAVCVQLVCKPDSTLESPGNFIEHWCLGPAPHLRLISRAVGLLVYRSIFKVAGDSEVQSSWSVRIHSSLSSLEGSSPHFSEVVPR